MNLHEMLTNFGVILLVFQQGNLVGVKMEVQFRGVLVVFLVILVDKAKGVSRWAQKVGILAVVCRLEEGIREVDFRLVLVVNRETEVLVVILGMVAGGVSRMEDFLEVFRAAEGFLVVHLEEAFLEHRWEEACLVQVLVEMFLHGLVV